MVTNRNHREGKKLHCRTINYYLKLSAFVTSVPLLTLISFSFKTSNTRMFLFLRTESGFYYPDVHYIHAARSPYVLSAMVRDYRWARQTIIDLHPFAYFPPSGSNTRRLNPFDTACNDKKTVTWSPTSFYLFIYFNLFVCLFVNVIRAPFMCCWIYLGLVSIVCL